MAGGPSRPIWGRSSSCTWRPVKAIKRIVTGGGGSSILVTPDGSQAYIGMTCADKVAVLDLGKLEVISEIKTGDGPDGMAWVGKP
jgi:YVTN family beta-propeller protein